MNRIETTAAILVLASFGCQQPGTATATLETDDQKASYVIGLQVGQSLTDIESHVDIAALRSGIDDALAGTEPRLSDEEIQQVMTTFSATVQAEQQGAMAEQQAEMAAQAQQNTEAGQAYLAQNAAKEGVTTTESGLQYEVLTPGDGPRPTAEDQVTVQYRGTLVDGTEFDSSTAPVQFPVTGVIPGFSEGLQLMPVGSKYRFVIPGDIAYGAGGRPPMIGPNATLIFEVELISIP